MRAKFVYENIRNYLDNEFTLSDKSPENTFLIGYVSASYNDLVELFGKPNNTGDGYNISIMWVLEDKDEHVVTIYDYKNDPHAPYISSTGDLRRLNVYKWHIGGNNYTAAQKLISMI